MRGNLVLVFLILFAASLQAQHTVSGLVSSTDRQKLSGATVFFKKSDIAGVTEDDGTYFIENVPSGQYDIEYSYLGYRDTVITVNISEDINIDVTLTGEFFNLSEVEIEANRVKDSQPFTYENVTSDDLQERNTAQDVPFLLNHLTNVVTTSDAGAGIGYTGMRLRGSDQTRINVTINGVPLNDAESQGVFWVDLPDFASSVRDVQVQRGVGTSTNGPGAFGGTVALNTHQINGDSYAEFNGSYGSFNTNKASVKLGTGILNDRFSVDARYSLINSDGYIDRSDSKLDSWMISPAIYWDEAMIRLDLFSGHERTQQAWWGTPQAKVEGNDEALLTHYNNNLGSTYNTVQDSTNLFGSDRRYNYYTYDDQVDDYTQTHVQLHGYKQWSDDATSRLTFYFTHGEGFYEEYRYQDELAFYDLTYENEAGDTIQNSDLVRRRWLSNNLFGAFTNNQIQINDRTLLDIGAGVSRYVGDHFGQVISLINSEDIYNLKPIWQYYKNQGVKSDYNAYAKLNYGLTDKLTAMVDLQARGINYTIKEDDNKIKELDIAQDYFFFNPKVGLTYLTNSFRAYASYAIGNKEPDRNDIINTADLSTLKHETLHDIEVGFEPRWKNVSLKANAYYMKYDNQLVLTGALNDVGANLRTNVDNSYRAGVELGLGAKLANRINVTGNLALSQNKIDKFTEVIYDYTNGYDIIENEYTDTDISFSPNIVTNLGLGSEILNGLTVGIEGKYVGDQYLDNTSNDNRKLDAYFTSNATLRYEPSIRALKKASIGLQVFNLTNTLYSANGYTYSYKYGDLITENFLYPQAETYFLVSLQVRI